MRYTLRLLTVQQFQRAAALLCACEMIRRQAQAAGDGRWGEVPFRLGLWVGARVTRTRGEHAARAIKEAKGFSGPEGRPTLYRSPPARGAGHPSAPPGTPSPTRCDAGRSSTAAIPWAVARSAEGGPKPKGCPWSPWTTRSTASYPEW